MGRAGQARAMWLRAIIVLLVVALVGVVSPAVAQSLAPLEGQSQTAEAPPVPPTPAATAEAAAANDKAPQFPAVMTDRATESSTMDLLVLPLPVDDLKVLADIWLGYAMADTQKVTDLRLALRAAEAADADGIRDELSAALDIRGQTFEVLSSIVGDFQAKGGDEAEVKRYRDYRNAVLAAEVQRTDWQTLLKLGLNWLIDIHGGLAFLIKAVAIVGAFILLLIVGRVAQGMSSRGLRKVPNISRLLAAFLAGIVYWVTIAVGLMVVLSALGVNITPLFALFGGAAFIVAFAMQDTLGNLAAGVMIIVNRPFDEGDYVNVAGVGGTVKSVSIVSTVVATPDNQVIVIPNSKVWGDIITNVTASTTRRVDLVFGIGYDDSIEDAQRVMEKVAAAHPLVLDDPKPVIRVNELAESSVNFICRPWVRSADYWTVYWDLTRQVKEAFDAAGISIPFPQTDMNLRMSSPLQLAEAAASAPGAAAGKTGKGRPVGAPDFATGDAAE